MKIFSIKGGIKNYAWGTFDFIKSLLSLDTELPVAEYWLGTHFLGETLADDGRTLSERIGYKLPFLFKLLSISTPLAIQCHPSASQAEDGYRKESLISLDDELRNYPDDNEKTEATVALTDFTLMYGIRELGEIKNNLKSFVPSLYSLFKSAKDVEEILIALPILDKETKDRALRELEERVGKEQKEGNILSPSELCALCLSLYRDDIWCVSPLIFNVLNLKEGDSLFISPGIIHAYCRGNCLEVMTSSDNMTRLGLTPRHTDYEEFFKIATLSPNKVQLSRVTEIEKGAYLYSYDFGDIHLIRYENSSHLLPEREDGILFSPMGKAKIEEGSESVVMEKGDAYFIPKGVKVKIEPSGPIYFAYRGCHD